MRPLKRLGIIIIVALVLITLSKSFVVISLVDRAIILALGIDYREEKYIISCEVLSAKNNSGDTGASAETSKLIVGEGATVSLAIHDVYKKTGKLPSLGQCGIIVLGESLYKNVSLEQCLAYFSFSDAFKDGSIVACCQGEAFDLFNCTSLLDDSLAFSLQEIIQGSDKNTAIYESYLSKFVSQQVTTAGAGCLSLIKFIPSGQKDGYTELGLFDVDSIAIFSNFSYAGELSFGEKTGLMLMTEPKAFNTFIVKAGEDEPLFADMVGLGIVSKKIGKDAKFEGEPTYTIDISMTVKRMKTDTIGNVSKLLPKTSKEIDESMRQQVKEKATALVQSALDKAVATNCDYIGIKNDFYKKYGKDWVAYVQDNVDTLKKIKYVINVEVGI